MVTIRNDIEANGNANRATDSAASVVDGSKNVNHLANGSRRSTMADIKPKAFNRKCVGLLALIVCVGVCFGVGMLFLYGHLEDRLNESASHGSMLHDKNGNPVKPITTSTTTSTTTEPVVTSLPTTVVVISTTTSVPTTSSTTEKFTTTSVPTKKWQGTIFFDSFIPQSVNYTPARPTLIVIGTKGKGTKNQSGKPRANIFDDDYASSGFGDDTDDDDDDFGSGSGSGSNK